MCHRSRKQAPDAMWARMCPTQPLLWDSPRIGLWDSSIHRLVECLLPSFSEAQPNVLWVWGHPRVVMRLFAFSCGAASLR